MGIDFDIKESAILSGVFVITPSISWDNRGNIWTSFLKDEIEKLLPKGLNFKHDKFSLSAKDVLRGIHGDEKSFKLVTCVYGEILQVVVDLRKGSSSYLMHEKFIINKNAQKLVLIPPNMGNAYLVRSNEAVYHYKLAYEGEYIDAPQQFSLPYNDSRINIDWGIQNPILSGRDLKSTK